METGLYRGFTLSSSVMWGGGGGVTGQASYLERMLHVKQQGCKVSRNLHCCLYRLLHDMQFDCGHVLTCLC